MKKIVLIILAFGLLSTSFSQSEVKGKFKRISLDLYGGVPFFHGDIENDYVGYSATARLNWNLTSAFSIGGEFTYGSLKGLDDNSTGSFFQNNYLKAMIGSEVYLFNPLRFSEVTRWFQPYVGLSLGAIKSNIEKSGTATIDNPMHYNDWDFAQQWNMGSKFKLAKWLDLNVRYSIVYTNTDLLDNLEPSSNKNRNNDAFSNLEVGFTFHIGSKGKQPIIWNPADGMTEDMATKADQDSLMAKIDEVKEEQTATEEELAEVEGENDQLTERVNALEDMLSALSKSVAENGAGSNKGDDFFGADEHIYEATLEGPLDADYYIVAGSYAIKENADSRVAELKAKGLKPVILREVNADLNRVVVDSTNDYKKALELVSKYRKETDPSAWIIKQRRF